VIRAVLGRLRELGVGAASGPNAEGRLPNADLTPAVTAPASAALPATESRMASPFRPFSGPSAVVTLEPKRVGDNALHLKPTHSAIGTASSSLTTSRPSALPSASPVPATTPAWRFVGIAHGAYTLFETTAGLVLLDRRAAHERVWFERLREQFRRGAVPSQRLLLPVPIELDVIGAALLMDRLKFLHAHGLEIAEFGRNFFRVESVPSWMEPADAESFVRDLLGAFREGTIPDQNTELAREELARLAAAKAIRLPETSGEPEMRGLVTQLFATRSPLTSPAGRPTYIELNHGELARRFQK
jgi:DNA mismatch repair protein MutL